MAIDLAEPNTYQTACGKGYWECVANEPTSITLANAGVLYSPFEQGGAAIRCASYLSTSYRTTSAFMATES